MTSATDYFRAKLEFEIDVMDVADGLTNNQFILVDSRRRSSWDHGHIPGAIHLPTVMIAESAQNLIPRDMRVVVYSWGPGCNGSTFAALALAELHYPVQEMIGGIEYWQRNGLPVASQSGVSPGLRDNLVTAHAEQERRERT